MKISIFRLIALTCLALSLSACFGPKSPQEVTKAFWEAVLDNNAKYAVEYSTLSESKYYDSFSKDWSGYEPSFGKVIIEKKEASVVTEFSSPANSGLASRNFTTYLVLSNGEWKVDYDRTKDSVLGGSLGDLVSTLNKMGDDLSKQLQSSADRFRVEMERMARVLEQESRSYRQQAQKTLEQYAEQLRKSIKELQDSINRALKEENKNLSDKDKRTLREISEDLDMESESLSRPNYETVAKGSQEFSENQQQLEMMDNDSLVEYKKEWRELGKRFEDAMRKMMNELSSQYKGGDMTE
jgi:uncharacterized protein (DUF885 family)